MAADLLPNRSATSSWPLRDYIAPGLRVVRPDAAFPHMRAGDAQHHPWKYLRRDVPHFWYVDERFPLMGFMNRDEAVLLHNLALPFAGKRALEIGSWLGWSTCHLALAGVVLDVIDPAHDDPLVRVSVEQSLAACGVSDRVHLAAGRSPDSIAPLGRKWSFFFIDGDHEGAAPARDALACLPYAEDDCAFVFHDLASPAVAMALRVLAERGFHVMVYQTAQIMGIAWRGDVAPVAHVPDPDVAWQLPAHLEGLPVCGANAEPPSRRAIRDLRDAFGGAAAEPLPSVCIVTSELIGPFKNGGIGTAMTGLAEWLAANGARVTVLYTGGIWSGASLDGWRTQYASKGIQLDALSTDDAKHLAGPLATHGYLAPWLVNRYLAARRFDVVHFNDCCGEGSLALAAKRLGVAHGDSLLCVALHSPSRWVIDANRKLAATPVLAAFDHAERLSAASADMLWSPSRYLLDWAVDHGFTLPEQTFVQQYVMPSSRGADAVASGTRVPVNEIVFFGRLEERKGLAVFCAALDLVRDELAARGVAVTFLGKPEQCGGMPALDFIRARSESWRFAVKTLTEYGQPEAVAYLRAGSRMAVMPSPLDNSPCTVYEALAYGVPFLAARTGGIPELIDPAERQRVLFEYGAEPLAAALRDAIEHGGWIGKPSVTQEETARAWSRMHAQWRTLLPERRTSEAKPMTVAAVIDHEAGMPLHLTVNSLVACPSVRRFIIINRGGQSLPMPNFDLTKDDPGVIAGEIAGIAEDVVLLIHSGVAVLPDALDAMLRAIGSAGVDGLSPAARVKGVRSERIVPPLGGSAAFSLFEGATFSGALLVGHDALAAAHGQRALASDAPFLGLADLCVAHSGNILPFPEVALEREERWPVAARTASPARIAMYAGASENDRYYMLASGYGAANGSRQRSIRRELAISAADAGLSAFLRIASSVSRRLRRWFR